MNLRRTTVAALVLGVAILALAGCSKSTSVTDPASLDSSTPAAPTNIVGTFDVSENKDYLIWTTSTSINAATYQVWEYGANPASGNPGAIVGSAYAGTTSFRLPQPQQNAPMYYRMRSVSPSGAFSAFSTTVRVQRHGAPVEATTDPGDGLPLVQIH